MRRGTACVDGHPQRAKRRGTDIGPPGLRDTARGYPPGYYAAFGLDPDGNSMEALFRGG